MHKKILTGAVTLCLLFSFFTPLSFPAEEISNPIAKFLSSLDYSSKIKFEFDDNIFLTEDNEDSDWREVFSQSLNYKLPGEKYYFQLGYNGSYGYYNNESTGILGHAANLLYSYRPFDGFSIGVRDDFNWLQDSTIATTIGDRVLGLGYVQNAPSIQIKKELSPEASLINDFSYQFLDVIDSDNDDYIDNKRVGVKTQVNYNLTAQRNLVGFAGFTHRQVTFPQVAEKASSSNRAYFGVLQKFIGLCDVTHEIGFENINMSDAANADDNNVDYRFSMETIFSLYTKLRLSFDYNVKNSSLRRQYSQYGSHLAGLNLSHAISDKTTLYVDYTYERQEFNSSDALIGQTKEDKETFIQNLRLTVSKKLKSWLTMETRYDYTKRDTDFAQEGYTDNKLSLAFTVKY